MTWTTIRSVNLPSSYGDPPLLHSAAKEGHVEKISQLLSQGADVNQLTKYKETPLHFAASEETSLEVVKMLVEAGADVNRRDIHKFTPLMYACIKGHSSIGCYLVENGADVNAADRYGTTPLLFAIRATSLRVPQISALLKAEACINVSNSEGMTPLHSIIESHDDAKWDVLELLLSYPCDINEMEKCVGPTLLLKAVWRDDRKSALMLIKAGCNVEPEDRKGWVPMFYAIKYKLYPLVELLLAAGARINRKGWIWLRRELESENPSMLERLLAVGAECPRLYIMCRRAFYDRYGTQTRNRIDELLLSPLMKMYLSYEIL